MITPFKHCLDYFHDIENRWKFLTTGVHYCQREVLFKINYEYLLKENNWLKYWFYNFDIFLRDNQMKIWQSYITAADLYWERNPSSLSWQQEYKMVHHLLKCHIKLAQPRRSLNVGCSWPGVFLLGASRRRGRFFSQLLFYHPHSLIKIFFS